MTTLQEQVPVQLLCSTDYDPSYQTCGHHICTVDVGDVKEEGLREVRQREGGEVEGERRAGLHVAFARQLLTSARDIVQAIVYTSMDNAYRDQISHSLWE